MNKLVKQRIGALLIAAGFAAIMLAGCSPPPRYENVLERAISVRVEDGVKVVQLSSGSYVSVPDSEACADVESGALLDIQRRVWPDGTTEIVSLNPVTDLTTT